ncbi:dr1-associated corepressor homolog [Oppia nitens]|uniref:dr1-associated corepressor homolog n=1 Tax=Oppia nitens TaxID=1686743 RepID=UPI0023DA254B|nr:dr1-associated corepressor homolog [Oppia nitens]
MSSIWFIQKQRDSRLNEIQITVTNSDLLNQNTNNLNSSSLYSSYSSNYNDSNKYDEINSMNLHENELYESDNYWRDEFDGQYLNEKKWDVYIGNYNHLGLFSGQISLYSNNDKNIQLFNGKLALTAIRESYNNINNTVQYNNYTSALIVSKELVDLDTIETRLAVPNGIAVIVDNMAHSGNSRKTDTDAKQWLNPTTCSTFVVDYVRAFNSKIIGNYNRHKAPNSVGQEKYRCRPLDSRLNVISVMNNDLLNKQNNGKQSKLCSLYYSRYSNQFNYNDEEENEKYDEISSVFMVNENDLYESDSNYCTLHSSS